jgi:hypothetical protein
MQQIGYDILAYLAEHPDAQDTTEGITEWWLSERPARPNAARVEEALAELVALGLVLQRGSEDARTSYKANRRRLGEIAALLARHAGGSAGGN